MQQSSNKESFMQWCKELYDENCLERQTHGLEPYKNFETYYFKHHLWLDRKYNNDEETRSKF